MTQQFKRLTLQEIMDLPPENREEAYRRGYRDGYIQGSQDVAGQHKKQVPGAVWEFWANGELLQWANKPGDFEPPPLLDL